VGLDVTAQCVLSENEVDRIYHCSGAAERYLCSLMDIWLHTSIAGKVTLHDPLAIAYLVDPGLLNMRSVPVAVEMDGEMTRGLTAVLRTPFRQRQAELEDNARIAVDVNVPKAKEILLSRVFNM